MEKTSSSLGKFELVKTHVTGTKADGRDYAFDTYSLVIKDKEINIQPKTEDKSLFDFLLELLSQSK